MGLKRIRRLSALGQIAKRLWWRIRHGEDVPFSGSTRYWEERYARGGTSGSGSGGKLRDFKAEVLNEFVTKHDVGSVIEFGCGDGRQLELADYPQYLGLDVSETAISLCRRAFRSDPTKRFSLIGEYDGSKADLALSLDVIYHLVEDDVYEEYMSMLFAGSNRYVIIYSTDTDDNPQGTDRHERHRRFTPWVSTHHEDWTLVRQIPNRFPYDPVTGTGSRSSFFIFEKSRAGD